MWWWQCLVAAEVAVGTGLGVTKMVGITSELLSCNLRSLSWQSHLFSPLPGFHLAHYSVRITQGYPNSKVLVIFPVKWLNVSVKEHTEFRWKPDFLESGVLAHLQLYRSRCQPPRAVSPTFSQAPFHHTAFREVSQGTKLLTMHCSKAADRQSINSSASTGNSRPEKAGRSRW